MKQFSLQKQKNLKIVQDAEKDIKYTRIFEDAYYTGKYWIDDINKRFISIF